jgi:hypothetical protein
MKQLCSTITTKLSATLFLLIGLATLAVAHGGFEHVMGTVVKVEKNTLTVKTAKGDVPVKLDGKTEFTKDDHKASVADLLPGLRVVVDLPEKVKNPAAHSIKIGAAEVSDTHEHSDHAEHSEHAEHK